MKRVVIVGGGIAGLSAAWALQKHGGIAVTVLERTDRWGGKVQTDRVGDFLIEAGPDSFLTQKPWALELARELRLTDHLIPINTEQRALYVLQRGRRVRMPEGVMLIAPTQFWPFIRSPLISPLGKLRMALDWLIPPRADPSDETLAHFVQRRLGREALDKIAEPLMSGIYNAEADRQSLLATFPRFRQLEQSHGSLIRGLIAARRNASRAKDQDALPPFLSLRGGVGQLIEALTAQLQADLRLNVAVTSIQSGYCLTLSDQTTLTADAVILATPADVSAGLLRHLAPTAALELARIRYLSTGTISFAFRADDLPQALDGFGIVVPIHEQRPINAITVSSLKFEGRAPTGHLLIRVFFGGARSPESMNLDDKALLGTVRAELASILGITAPPLFYRIYRWIKANPQYDLGHLERVNLIESQLPPGIKVTGSAYRGVGLPDCVYQATLTAQQVIRELIG
ncbi:MAG: protoporphyrinogen oxidase [Anaerolineae bacterium]|jgi:oxygen-dependent protoporphyrinogen oxidase|nr:protoporphyrinogen oxidase [Anaerolineae bacterium]